MASSSTGFITPDFLLESRYAQILYHEYAASLPIIDYHNHLPPQEIAENKQFRSMTEIWLKGDHYKWRAMRTLGVEENRITGTATDEEKFMAWAGCVPLTVRNPLFHWTHMELKDPFGITDYLNPATAAGIYAQGNELLGEKEFSTRGLLTHFKVEMACSTDDPLDNLDSHRKVATDGFSTRLLPGFRPDKVLQITDRNLFLEYIRKLEMACGQSITNLNSLLEALQQRVDYFHENGCRISDHGLLHIPPVMEFTQDLETEFSHFLQNRQAPSFSNPGAFAGTVLIALSKMYHQKGWVQQFHLGALRNNNSRLYRELGPDTGFDSMGDEKQARLLSEFLNELDRHNQLTKTILYNINPSDNELFASMIGNFNDGSIRGKIQFGSGWWFLDQMDGMTRQLNALSNMGLISTFIGMLTDSRSFLSFPRHDYFRRLLCNLFGNDMQKGLLPGDEKWMGEIIRNICYYNAKTYFNC